MIGSIHGWKSLGSESELSSPSSESGKSEASPDSDTESHSPPSVSDKLKAALLRIKCGDNF